MLSVKLQRKDGWNDAARASAIHPFSPGEWSLTTLMNWSPIVSPWYNNHTCHLLPALLPASCSSSWENWGRQRRQPVPSPAACLQGSSTLTHSAIFCTRQERRTHANIAYKILTRLKNGTRICLSNLKRLHFILCMFISLTRSYCCQQTITTLYISTAENWRDTFVNSWPLLQGWNDNKNKKVCLDANIFEKM